MTRYNAAIIVTRLLDLAVQYESEGLWALANAIVDAAISVETHLTLTGLEEIMVDICIAFDRQGKYVLDYLADVYTIIKHKLECGALQWYDCLFYYANVKVVKQTRALIKQSLCRLGLDCVEVE